MDGNDRWNHLGGQPHPLNMFTATPTTDSKSQQAAKTDMEKPPVKVAFPDHLYAPKGVRTVDIRRLADIAAGTSTPFEFMRFVAPTGGVTFFYGYAIFSDGQLASNQQFIPRLNKKRVFTFHGDPNDDFKINLGLGPDLSDQNVIRTQLALNPGEIFTWEVINNNAVDISMGVRMVGYVDFTMKRVNQTVGG